MNASKEADSVHSKAKQNISLLSRRQSGRGENAANFYLNRQFCMKLRCFGDAERSSSFTKRIKAGRRDAAHDLFCQVMKRNTLRTDFLFMQCANIVIPLSRTPGLSADDRRVAVQQSAFEVFSGLAGRFVQLRTFRRQVACEERGKIRLKFNENDRDAFTCAASENDIFRISGFF